MKTLLNKYSTGKIVLILFIITNVVYVLMVAFTIPQTLQYAENMSLPDMMPGGYDLPYILELMTALGESGRLYYLKVQLLVDMFYPLLFALCYSLLLVYFLKRLKRQNGLLFYGAFLPLIGGAADYLENIGIMGMLKQFPEISDAKVRLTSTFSVIKSSATSLYFLLLIVVLVWWVFVWFKNRK